MVKNNNKLILSGLLWAVFRAKLGKQVVYYSYSFRKHLFSAYLAKTASSGN